MKKTRWFKPPVNPARVGVYEREASLFTDPFSYWDGRNWMESRRTPEMAFAYRNRGKSINQDLAWRGLAKKP